MTISSTSTASTFATASYASTAAVAGTAQAPFPPGFGGNGGSAIGPDDSYVVAAAMSLFTSSSYLVYLASTMVALVIGGVILL